MRHLAAISLLLGLWSGLSLATSPCTGSMAKVAPPATDIIWGKNDRLQFVVKGGATPFKRLRGSIMTAMARPFWLTGMSKVISNMTKDTRPDVSIHQKMLDALDISYATRGTPIESIPKEGGLLVYGNHPRFGAEGLAIAAMLMKIRPDVKVV